MDFDSLQDDSQAAPVQGPAPASASPGAVPSFDSLQDDSEKYGTFGQQVLAGVEGAAKGLAGPFAPMLERAVGADPAAIRGRAEANPWTHGIGEGVGFVGGALLGTGEAALVSKVGEGVVGAAGLAEAGSVGARLAAGATRLGAEMATIQAGDEASKAITQDPNQSVGSAISNIGLSAILGAAGGAAFSGAGMLTRGALEKSGLGNVLSDFKDRISYRAANLNPHEAMQYELTNAMNTFHDIGSEIGGTSGLKAQALEQAMPKELTPEISTAIQNVATKADNAATKMLEKGVPSNYISKYKSVINDFLETATNPEATVAQHFDAMNSLKKDLSDFSKGNYGPFAVPSYKPEYDFLNITKNVGHDIKNVLENPDVWGKDVAGLQKNLNAAWTTAIPAVRDAEKKFMSKVGNEFVVDPAKFNTYINQGNKATSQTVRQQMMGKFVEAMEKFHGATADIYEKAGLPPPPSPSIGALQESLNKASVGSRLADTWYDKLAGKAIAETGGAGVGGAIGHSTGIPGAGLAGTYLGGKLGESVLPSIIQPLLEKGANSQAFQQAMNFGQSVIKGDKLLSNSAKAIFQGGELIPKHLMPTTEKIEQLNDRVKELSANQNEMFKVGGDLGHYLPNHASALSETAMNAVNMINKFRPQNTKKLPLDADHPPSPMQKQAFNRALTVAQQPLMVMKHIKDGTLLPQDVEAVKTLYPKFYEKMSQQLVDEMTNHLADKKIVPYKLRQSMSLFLGQPLDSNLTPANIMAAQAVFMKQKMPAPPGAPGAGSKHSTKGMSDIANQYRTRDQSAIARQSKA